MWLLHNRWYVWRVDLEVLKNSFSIPNFIMTELLFNASTFSHKIDVSLFTSEQTFITIARQVNITAKKWSFPLRISSVNVTKSAGNWRNLTEEILNGKLHFLCSLFSQVSLLSAAYAQIDIQAHSPSMDLRTVLWKCIVALAVRILLKIAVSFSFSMSDALNCLWSTIVLAGEIMQK